MKPATLFSIVTIIVGTLLSSGQAQVSYGPLLFQDDFTTSNAVWRFKLVDVRDNQTAIDASYGRIENGVLALKANVDCGWDYLGSVASLQVPLPENYILEFRATKVQWCGALHAQVSFTNEMDDRVLIPPCYDFSAEGNWFAGFNVRTSTNVVTIPPAITSQENGTWYHFRVVKRRNRVQVFINDALQFSYSGAVLSGGFLHFFAASAGSTAEIDDLRIYAVGAALEIETAAVRVRWFAESNVTYQLQWTTNLQSWSNVLSIAGNGALTNILDWNDGPRRFYRVLEQ